MGASVCAIIPNYNGAELLSRYLPGVIDSIGPLGRVIVVDDASTDASVDALRSSFRAVDLVSRSENGGFSIAVNQGIGMAETDLVVLLNNDVEISPSFLDPILPLFEDGDVFAASPRILLPTKGNIDEGCKTGFWHHGMFYTSQRQGVAEVTPVLYANGCAAVYRRSMLVELRGFDEAYSPFYWEDTDLGYRAWKRGWKSLYQPASTVVHQHSATTSTFDPARTRRAQTRNGLIFIWRNIEDSRLIRAHRGWLPAVVSKKLAERDRPWVLGWWDAFARRRECATARDRDSKHRRLTDAEIFDIL